ncbi:MAG TPA: M43 family zinc metalloprotease [Puia sp.]|nr:M43 family zinc metalloprotease [Puia sp.]
MRYPKLTIHRPLRWALLLLLSGLTGHFAFAQTGPRGAHPAQSGLRGAQSAPGPEKLQAPEKEQGPGPTSCGQKAITDALFRTHPEILAKHIAIEQKLHAYLKSREARPTPFEVASIPHPPTTLAATIVLPVVVHIIHNNGAENISDAQVMTAIQHLNEAYANSGYYDPADGVNTNIQFCMAERGPDNNPTNGITRDVSPYTVMGGTDYYSDDQNVKNIRRWRPECYINIWVVKSIPGSVVGYAYLPSAHGTNLDGIILEAGYFGSSYPNDVVIAHEMGHYLGLYHTFEGGCTNNDCSLDGDQVCDTPPDQSTAGISCGSSMNSCTTDALSGFATDQPDLTQDYMDYGNFNCMKVFTQGQSDRMNWFIQNVRSSLLHCKSCQPPCPSPVTIAFSSPGTTVNAGSLYTFVNSSVNAGNYEWRVNGVLQSTSTDLPYTFGAPGSYTITLIGRSSDPLCDSAVKTITVTAVCPVTAAFTKSATTAGAGTPVNFTNTSAGATGYEWSVNGVLQATSTNFSYTTTSAGTYIVTLKAINTAAGCSQVFTDTVFFTCPVLADFTPASVTTLLNSPLTFTSTSSGATSYQWTINGAAAGTGGQLIHSFPVSGSYSVQLIASNGVCSSVKTGVVYVTDKCGNAVYLFRKNYNANASFLGRDLQYTPDGGSISAGRMIVGGVLQGALMKLDQAGNVQWTKVYNNGGNADLLKVKATLDGGYIAIGNLNGAGPGGGTSGLFVVKTVADGTIAWSRQLGFDGGSNGINIIQAAEGDYYFTGMLTSAGTVNGVTADALIGKLNAAGTLIWLRSYDARGTETPTSLAAEATTLIVCGNLVGQKGNQGFLMQVAKLDGAVSWSNTYQSATEDFRDVLVTPTGYLVDVLRSPGAGFVYTDHVYLQMNTAGNLTYSQYITPFAAGTSIGFSSVYLKPDGHWVSQSSVLFGGTFEDFLIQEVDPSAGIVWSKKYNEANTWITSLARKPDNSFFAYGWTLNGGPLSPFLMSVDTLGDGGSCPANPVTIPLSQATYMVGPADWLAKDLQVPLNTDLSATDKPVTVNTECQYIGCDSVVDSCLLCQHLKLNGVDSVCGLKHTVVYSAIRDTSCHSPVKWTVDLNFVNIVTTTDSTIELSVKQSGLVKLIGSITTPCKTIGDTLTLSLWQQQDTVNLGPDIQLCKQSTIHLNAGGGFATYTWQDGSADSSFTAYFPGEYFVNVTDHCGNVYGDTIGITQAPDVPFDLGPDTTICLHDSVQLTAPPGFVSYSWSPVYYAIDDPYSRTPFVYPAKDTSYTCVALKYPGCTVTDTIHITVLPGVPRGLLPDSASFCKGETVQLASSGVWQAYLWSDGETGPSIQVSAPGLYWVMVTDGDKCTGRDSVIVAELNCRKGIHYPNAFTPNSNGTNDLFRAILDEMPVSYEFVIYNRWGEKVFETKDPLGGWNGVFRGHPQDAGGFAWYAVYQFAADKKEQVQKGVVILVR